MQNSHDNLRELTLRGMLLGALITIVFTASNVYLGLKVGLTFASSIPAAVISMAVLKMFSGSNILENNMVQTQASAAGTLSAVIFILPGMLMLGYWDHFPFWQTVLICAIGGVLGVVFTIPLRYAMVVKSDLPYPEGVAAAEILKAGNGDENNAEGESGIKEIVTGGLLSGLFAFLSSGLRVISDSASYWFKAGSSIFQVPMGFSLALLGAGYLIGIVGGLAILFGIFFAWGIAVPYFTATNAMPADADMINFAMGLWKAKVRFIGIGIMAVAAIWTLVSLLKPMMEGMARSFRMLKDPQAYQQTERTEQDLSIKSMVNLTLITTLLIAFTLYLFVKDVDISAGVAALLIAVCTLFIILIGFLVAAACGYMAGLVGSSSSPISGIGIISVIVISLVLMLVGNSTGLLASEQGQQFLIALTLFSGAFVIAIATVSNDNLQDLKTGLLVKATPWRQQVALIIGSIVGAFVIAPVMEMLYHAYGFTGALPRESMDPTQALSAPQATLMTTIAKGIFNANLEWGYIFTGVGLGIALILIDFILKRQSQGRFGLPVLAVGMGIYLPPEINMPIVFGAIISWLINRHLVSYGKKTGKNPETLKKSAERNGTLFAAGLIVGESLIGVILAFIIATSVTTGGSEAPLAIQLENWQNTAEWLGLAFFVIGAIVLAKRVLRAKQ